MDDDINNINLLPEDQRGEEKQRPTTGDNIPVRFHIPEEPKKRETPLPPRVDSLAEEISPLTEKEVTPLESKEKVVPAKEVLKTAPVPKKVKRPKKIKPSSKKGFLAGLFKKKKVALTLEEEAKVPKTFPPSTKEGPTPLKGKIVEGEPFLDGMDVNLIPVGAYLLPNRKIFTSLLLSAFISLLVILLVYLGLVFYNAYLQKQSERLDLELQQGEQLFTQYKLLEEEALLLSKRLESAKAILEKHVYWTKVFSALERLTIEDVYYDTIAANLNGVITLSASAPNYTAVARQYLVFQQATEIIESIQISGASGDVLANQVDFNIILKLKPYLFYSLSSS